MSDTITLAEHAESWWEENGCIVPSRDTLEWKIMYENWIEFAFRDFDDRFNQI